MIKKTIFIIGLICLARELVSAQHVPVYREWIFLRTNTSSVLPSVNPAVYGISERALQRRAKVLPPDRLIDQYDIPVSETDIAAIKQTGVKIRTTSRWLHAVSVEGTREQIQAVRNLPSTIATQRVAEFRRPKLVPISIVPGAAALNKSAGVSALDYGYSAVQVANINAIPLHELGITGSGVLIGMLDDGYNNHSVHRATKDAKVIAEHDFVYHDGNTMREPWEASGEGNHGAGTFSTIAAYDPGSLIGVAFSASFVLAKTENDSGETHIEEDNYVAGLEWMELLGVDIASSSLGYKQFDTSTYSYWHPDLDGKTTIVAAAASIAARKGILLVTAMGNEGYATGSKNSFLYADTTLVSPADADSIIAVGATSSDRELATFSGTGPTADGRIKPELVAQGMAIFWANGSTTSGYVSANGTSCSTPLVAGAAALVLSAHPKLTPMQVREALIQTALPVYTGTIQTVTYPNNYYGYGFVDAFNAALHSGPLFSNTPQVLFVDSSVRITTRVLISAGAAFDTLSFYYRTGTSGAFTSRPLLPTTAPNEFSVSLSSDIGDTLYGYFYGREHLGGASYFPQYAPDSVYLFSVQIPTSIVLYNNYPNPFNDGTVLSFDLPQKGHVELTVWNILGERMGTVFSGDAPSGRNTFNWNGRNDRGVRCASGVYFYRLKTPETVISKKMLYLK